LFKEQLGYDYYSNWEEGDKNSNIEESYLGKYLLKQGYSPTVYGKAIYELKQVADSFSDDLYLKTKRFMRCFAVKVKERSRDQLYHCPSN
jgi:type I restriction enzyme R subunit